MEIREFEVCCHDIAEKNQRNNGTIPPEAG